MSSALWEKQENETSKAYGAFCIYRDLGPQRSMPKVVQKLAKKEHYKTVLKRWSKQHDWVERAEAWDEHKDRVARETEIKELKDMRRRHIQMALALQTKAARRLNVLKPEDLTPKHVLAYIQEAVKLERLSRGEPESIAEERRRIDERDAKLIAELATDPAFLGAIQKAIEAAEGESDPDGGAGPVAAGEDRGAHVVKAAGDRPGSGVKRKGRGGKLQQRGKELPGSQAGGLVDEDLQSGSSPDDGAD